MTGLTTSLRAARAVDIEEFVTNVYKRPVIWMGLALLLILAACLGKPTPHARDFPFFPARRTHQHLASH